MGLFGKKQKKTKETKLDKVSSTLIKVKIFKSLGGDIDVLKNEYMATEKRDEFGELVSINDKNDHKEDVDFQMDSIYIEMQILLNFRNKNKKSQEDLLSKRIRKQEKLIFFLDKVPELNALYNYQDEWGKLRDYRVLKNYLQLDSHGSYFYIDNGIRTYEFNSIDGFLIPRWRGSDNYSSYPDHTRTKKIKIQSDFRFQKEMAGYKLDNKLINYGFWFFAINLILLILIGVGGYQLYQKSQDLSEPYNEASERCLESISVLNREYSDVINDAIILKREIIKEKAEKNSTVIENIIKDITPNG